MRQYRAVVSGMVALSALMASGAGISPEIEKVRSRPGTTGETSNHEINCVLMVRYPPENSVQGVLTISGSLLTNLMVSLEVVQDSTTMVQTALCPHPTGRDKEESAFDFTIREDLLAESYIGISSQGRMLRLDLGTVEIAPKPPYLHVIAKGQDLYYLSVTYACSVETIMKVNNLTGTTLKVGQELRIPEPYENADSSFDDK